MTTITAFHAHVCRVTGVLALAMLAAALPGAAAARVPDCAGVLASAARAAGVPPDLMLAVGRTEAGRTVGGRVVVWPWALNVGGKAHYAGSAAEALAVVREGHARGTTSIDVGCGQINLGWHPDAFASLEEALDPATNAAYAARYLRSLYDRHGSWTAAVAHYHSARPEAQRRYVCLVYRRLTELRYGRAASCRDS